MKKVLSLLLVLTMVFALAACGGGTTSEQPASTPVADVQDDSSAPAETDDGDTDNATGGDYSGYKVAVLLPGTINDNGWNAYGYTGLKHLEDKFGVQTQYTESVSNSDMEEYLRGYAEQGYDIIIGHSSSFADALKKVAESYPDIYFFNTNISEDFIQDPNVACFGAVDSGFLAGIVAGMLTETGVVGVLGGETSPSITPIVERFEDGAKFANPDVEVLSGYIGSLVDADKAKEMTATYISQGADIVCGSADSAGLGILQAADENGVYAIGFNGDQYEVAPNAVIVSVDRDFERMFENSFLMVVNGEFEADMYSYGIPEGGTSLTDWHGWDEKMDPEKMAALNELLEGIMDGSIKID